MNALHTIAENCSCILFVEFPFDTFKPRTQCIHYYFCWMINSRLAYHKQQMLCIKFTTIRITNKVVNVWVILWKRFYLSGMSTFVSLLIRQKQKQKQNTYETKIYQVHFISLIGIPHINSGIETHHNLSSEWPSIVGSVIVNSKQYVSLFPFNNPACN